MKNATWRRLALYGVLLLLLCLPAGGLAQGKGQGVEVRAVPPKLQDVSPGYILSLSFLVTNHTDRQDEFFESLQLPPGWQAITPAASFRLRAADATIRLVAFQVPPSTPAGRYEVTYVVRSQRDYAVQDADTIRIVVLPVIKVALFLEEKPDSVIAGETYQVRLRLVNQGNVELKSKLEVTSKEKYPAKIEPIEVMLAAGESAPLIVTVQTDPQERRPGTHYVQVKAQAVETNNVEATASITVGVEIISRVTDEFDMYHRLPAEITLLLSGENQDNALQVEMRGAGTLDEAGVQRVNFLLRAPDTQDKETFGLHDEYRFNYSTDALTVHLGDQGYGLSWLTSYYRYGRGLGVDFHPPDNPTFLGAYYLNERWARPDRQEGGLYLGGRLNDRLLARLNLLRKEQDAFSGQAALADTLWSLEGKIKPREHMNLQVEYARCQSNRAGSNNDSAYRIEWDGRMGQGGYYRVGKFHAEPDYYGYYHDSDHSYASLRYPLAPRLQGHLSCSRYESNLDLHPQKMTAQRETLWQAGTKYSFDSKWYLSLNYDYFTRYDRLMPPAFDYQEKALRLGIGRSAENYGFHVELCGGNQEDHLTGQSERVWNYNIFTSYRPRRDTSFTLYAGFGDNRVLRDSRLLKATNNLGASVAWQPLPDLSLDFRYTNYGFDSGDYPESNQYTFRLGHRLFSSHEIALQIHHNTPELGESETSYQLVYTIPFGIPLSRKRAVGSIRGRVYDAEVGTGAGVANAIFRINGATAVTNQAGEFVFPSVAPGTYQIYVDRASIGLDRVTEQKLPLTVEVNAEEVTQVEIGVVTAATVSGRVLVMPANNSDQTLQNPNDVFVIGEPTNKVRREPTGLPNVLVELANGQEILRRVTDHKGQFMFESLRPGSWRFKVYDHNLPPYHYLETPQQDLILVPGQSVEITVKVLPKARPIRFIDEGEIKVIREAEEVTRETEGIEIAQAPKGRRSSLILLAAALILFILIICIGFLKLKR